ncbi:hypothetical protein BDQ17DRAFT_1539525 [Cyathus striatus]|nr:hypothetical protein BDQ17DRAFT_1539525 [Cyathus striatus]
MNYSDDFIFQPGICFVAQTIPNVLENGPINPDIGGLAVGLASIIINILLPILLRWQQDDIQSSLFMLLLQVYPILISTMASIHSGAFSLFDAHFQSRLQLLLQRIHRLKKLMIAFGVLLPALWITLHIIISFDGNAFRNSQYCSGTNILDWLVFLTVSNFVGVLDVMGRRDLWSDIQGRGCLGVISLVVLWMWGLYFVRHIDDILQEYVERRNTYRSYSRLKRLAYLLWQIIATPWDIISSSHPWTVLFIVIGLHWSWVLGIVKGLSLDNANVTYGQVLSLFSVVPPLVEVWKLILVKYRGLWNCVRDLPSSFVNGHQWEHFCDGFPGEVVLTGLSYRFQSSIASFYFRPSEFNLTKEFTFNYFLSPNINGSSSIRNLYFGEVNPNLNIHEDLLPSSRDLIFNLGNNTVLGKCIDPALNSTEVTYRPCMTGNFTVEGFLTFAIEDMLTNAIIHLRAQDRQWLFSSDAPSFILRYVEHDSSLGPTALQTAVTRRNFCDTLKVCVSSGMAPGFDVIAPLGLALIMQDRYADTCMEPMVYSNR